MDTTRRVVAHQKVWCNLVDAMILHRTSHHSLLYETSLKSIQKYLSVLPCNVSRCEFQLRPRFKAESAGRLERGCRLQGEAQRGRHPRMLRPVVRPLSPSMGVMLLQLVVWLQILTAMVTYSSVSGLDITLSNKEGFERAPSCRHSVARIEITNTVRSVLDRMSS